MIFVEAKLICAQSTSDFSGLSSLCPNEDREQHDAAFGGYPETPHLDRRTNRELRYCFSELASMAASQALHSLIFRFRVDEFAAASGFARLCQIGVLANRIFARNSQSTLSAHPKGRLQRV